VLIDNIVIICRVMNERNVVEFETVAFVNDIIGYASDYETNALYKVNVLNEECSYIRSFPNEDIGAKRLHSFAIYCNSEVYFIPMLGEYISIYNIETEKIKQIKIPKICMERDTYNHKLKFSSAIYRDGYIYILPFTYPGIVKLNTETKEINIISNWVTEDECFYRGGMCIDNDYIYIPNGRNNIVLEFNIKTEEVKLYRVGKNNNGAVCIRKWKEYFWIVPRLKGSVVCWDAKKNQVIYEINEYPNGFEFEKILFSEAVIWNDKMYLVPTSANEVLSVNADKKKLDIEKKCIKNSKEILASMFETNNDYYFVNIDNLGNIVKHYKVSKKNGNIECYGFNILNKYEMIDNYFDSSIKQNKVMLENKRFQLDDFLKLNIERR